VKVNAKAFDCEKSYQEYIMLKTALLYEFRSGCKVFYIVV
jgi:hypothetical protein